MKELDEITGAIVDASVKIHRDLGPRRLESPKEVVLARVFVGLPISTSPRLRVNRPFPPGWKPRLTGRQDAVAPGFPAGCSCGMHEVKDRRARFGPGGRMPAATVAWAQT